MASSTKYELLCGALAALLLGACGTDGNGNGSGGEGNTETDPSSTQTPETSTTGSSATSTETSAGTTSTSDFTPATTPPAVNCGVFDQDCPEGEKCVPYAGSGGANYDTFKCVPVTGSQAPGEPCSSAGVVEATDDCDASSICFNLEEDGDGFSGTCVAQCTGTPETPMCDEGYFCSLSGEGVLVLCLLECDPVAQDCGEGEGCYWSGQQFACISTTQDIPTGSPCSFVNDCAPGNLCAPAMVLPACEGEACCTIYCDINGGDQPCEDALPGTACVSFWDGEPPEGYEDVGACVSA